MSQATRRAVILVPDPAYPEAWDWAYDVEASALHDGGFAVEPRPWTDVGDLCGVDLVLPLVAWGYQTDPTGWAALLDRLEREGVHVLNPVSVLRWNGHKAYLMALAEAGVPTIPTLMVDCLDEAALAEARAALGDHLVIKPPVSASAYGTHLLGPTDPVPDDARGKAMMVQPFCRAVAEEGEYSLLFFGGQFSHAIVKRPKAGDYRVQPHLGGREERCDPPEGAIAIAARALAAAPADCTYARVDLLRRDDGGLAVIELELIEPSLWLDLADDGGRLFVDAVRRAAQP